MIPAARSATRPFRAGGPGPRAAHGSWYWRSGGLLLALLLPAALLAPERDLDLIIGGGRVLDPETGLDGVRDVGVVRNEIVAISGGALRNRLKQGGVLLDASGKVVSPGFIDLHAHGQTTEANRYQAMDGVTTALELEDGVPRIKRYLENRAGGAIIHDGASVRHQGLRLLGIPGIAERAGPVLDAESIGAERTLEHVNLRRDANDTGVENPEVVHEAIAAEIRNGGLGIGMAPQYGFSDGVTHVVVDGVPVVRDGALVDGVFPGKPLLGRYTSE